MVRREGHPRLRDGSGQRGSGPMSEKKRDAVWGRLHIQGFEVGRRGGRWLEGTFQERDTSGDGSDVDVGEPRKVTMSLAGLVECLSIYTAVPAAWPSGRDDPGFVVEGRFYTKGSGGRYRLFATTQ